MKRIRKVSTICEYFLIYWQATDGSTRKVVFTYSVFKAFKIIKRPDDCKIRSVIHVLNAGNVKLADLHRQYTVKMMSDGMVRKWIRKFDERRDNVHDEPRSGRPSVVSDGLVHAVAAKVLEDRRFTISSLPLHLLQISTAVLYKIVTDHLDSRWVPKMLSEEHLKKRTSSALTFLTRCSKQGDGFLSQIVTGDET